MIDLGIDWTGLENSMKCAINYAINGCDKGNNVYWATDTCGRTCSKSGIFAEISILSMQQTDSAGCVEYVPRCTDLVDAAENGEMQSLTAGAVELEITVEIVAQGPAAVGGLCGSAWSSAIGLVGSLETDDFRGRLCDQLSFQSIDGTPVASPVTTKGMVKEQRIAIDMTFLVSYLIPGCPIFGIDNIKAPLCQGDTVIPFSSDMLTVDQPINGQQVSSFVFSGTAEPGSHIAILDKLKVVGQGVADSDGLYSVEAWPGVDLVDAQSKWLDSAPREFVVFAKWGDCCYTSRCITASYNPLAT